jgi:hypothetical protein
MKNFIVAIFVVAMVLLVGSFGQVVAAPVAQHPDGSKFVVDRSVSPEQSAAFEKSERRQRYSNFVLALDNPWFQVAEIMSYVALVAWLVTHRRPRLTNTRLSYGVLDGHRVVHRH